MLAMKNYFQNSNTPIENKIFLSNQDISLTNNHHNSTPEEKESLSNPYASDTIRNCYKSLFDNAPVGIFSVNENGDILEANKELIKILGSPSIEQTQSINIFSFPALEKTLLPSAIKKCFQTGTKVSGEGKYTSKWGETINISFQGAPGIIKENVIQTIQVFINDISGKKEAEEEMLFAKNRYQNLFNASPIPMWEQDFTYLRMHLLHLHKSGILDVNKFLQENHNEIITFLKKSKIIDVNQACINLFGAESKQQLINDFELVITKELFKTVAKAIVSVSQYKNDFVNETKIVTFSGAVRNVILSVRIDKRKKDSNHAIIALTDISESKKAINDLRKNEEKYRSLFQNAPIGICSVNRNGEILEVNDKMLETLGSPSREKTKQINVLSFPSLVQSGISTAVESCFSTGESVNGETKYDSFWGKSSIVHFQIASNSKINNEVKTVQILIKDISKRHKAEDELRLSEEKFKNLVHHSINGIATINTDGIITFANKALSSILDYPPQEIINHHFTKFLHNNTKKEDLETFESQLKEENLIHRKDINLTRKNGEIRRVEILSNRITAEKGESNIIAHVSDINERWRYEKIQNILLEISKLFSTTTHLKTFLKKVHQKLNQLIKTENFFVALYDKNTDKYTIPYYSDEQDSFETKKPRKAVGSLTDYVRRTQEAQLVDSEKKNQLINTKSIHKIGTASKIWLGAPLFNDDQKNVIGVISIQDYQNENAFNKNDLEILKLIANNIGFFIDRIRNLNDLKNAKEKAEESDRLKTAFLANMSHEIRTPLNGILGFTQLLKINNLSEDEKVECLDIIEESGERLLDTVNDVIDISKIEANQIQNHYSEVNINEQIRYLYHFFQSEARDRSIKLHFNSFLNNIEAATITDKNKFTAILKNLIKNALKYTMSGSIELGCSLDDRFYSFYVKDTGIGIPEDRQKAIFDRFVQADIEDKEVKEGAGLGLSIAKAYVEMLGGSIRVESIAEKGSTFYFTIAVKKQTILKV